MKYLLIILLFTGCINQRKVTDYLDQHPQYTADQCAVRFPIRTSIEVRPDTAKYERTISRLTAYADSLAGLAAEKDDFIAALNSSFDNAVDHEQYNEETVKDLQAQAKKIPKTDLEQLKDSWEKEFRKTIPICQDSLIRAESTAKVTSLEYKLSDTTTALKVVRLQRDALKSRLAGKILIPWWWALIAGLALVGWIAWQVKSGALNNVLSKI